ncbi:MAG: adenylate/guanylate cyclase domain-containing protein [Acidobacteria bacterium]|nr:adenylate/guanylate cyclase domain-containing protein [Acidobacteriota bacterium]
MSDPIDAELKGSAARLWRLIEARAKDGADKAAIDRRIWNLFGETWAILYSDLSGFSRQVASFGITHFLQIIQEHKKLFAPIIERNDGILIKIEADSLLVVFRKPGRALQCAIEMQKVSNVYNLVRVPEEQIHLCVGIGYGELLKIGDEDVYGQEVNSASKLGEDIAKSGEILLTFDAREAIGEFPGVRFAERDVPVAGSETSYAVEYRAWLSAEE